MNKRHYEHTLPNIRGSLSNTYDADEQEKQQAREVLPAVMGSDVWDEMLDEFEGARQRVARLMNNSNV